MTDVTTKFDRPHGASMSGLVWLGLGVLGALLFFWEGLRALLTVWATPEYSHGPIIPVLSALLFLRHLKTEPVNHAPVSRTPGLALLGIALALALIGKLAEISDVVAYALILWVGALILICFGGRQGLRFWPAVLHLVYMLPLPGVLYYKLSTYLQTVSSELGVWMLQLLSVPVFLDGNIIELDTIKLHVAEACSGLRYLFPILSFSYVFAVLYRGPMWHKALLLLAAAPITIVMNAVRIALAGLLVKHWGVEHLEGFTHFFEGWVIFLACILLLLLMAQILLLFRRPTVHFLDAFDLEFQGLWAQATRIRQIDASWALKLMSVTMLAGALLWAVRDEPVHPPVDRLPFALFPDQVGTWHGEEMSRFAADVERVLGADDYTRRLYRDPNAAQTVELFTAYYHDQTEGGTHSPEICLPSSGWEIASLSRVTKTLPQAETLELNRAVIQKGEARMMAYYWFAQHGRHVAWDIEAKLMLMWDGITLGRTDGAIVRLISPIGENETDAAAEARLDRFLGDIFAELPAFIPPAEALQK